MLFRSHTDATGRVATFVAQSGGYQLFYINATDDTIGEAINDAGQVSGLFSTPGPASTTHGFIATPATLPVGTTASGAYVFSVDVVANTPIFIDPEVALGYDYRTGHGDPNFVTVRLPIRSEEHTSELQSLMRISYAVFCLKKNNITQT